jgi:AcrR family transcriptional regulator
MSTPRVRLSPGERRLQLLDLGTRLFATRPVEEISIDLLAEEAGVSRGLLYHYFGGKQDFREAVIRHAVEHLVEQTAPPATGEPLERLATSVGGYVDYVVANLTGYRSLVRAAAGGSEDLRAIYEEARTALTDRIFREDSLGDHLSDDAATRLVIRGWSALVEEMVLTWVQEPAALSRDHLVDTLVGALPALVGVVGGDSVGSS